jgi:hypothetical protein
MPEVFSPVGNLAAAARVLADGTPVAPLRGFTGLVTPHVTGIYVLNLAPGFQVSREDGVVLASPRFALTGDVVPVDEPNARIITGGTQVEVRTFVGGVLTDIPFDVQVRRRASGGQAYPQNDGVGPLIAGGNISAAGALVGRSQGISAVGVLANLFAVTLAQGFGVPLLWSSIKATVQGAVAGSAVVVQTGPNALGVATYNSAGAPVALPFSLSVRSKYQSGNRRRGPIGNIIASALTDVVAGAPDYVGLAFGLSGAAPVDVGVGVYEYTLGNPISPLDAVVHAQPADETAVPLDSFVTTEHVSPTLVRVRTFDAGTPADRNHYLHVERVGRGAN